ncbi:MAG: hypothetical protein K2X39_06070, partial [Silvanigrellaceae bacterium]|nr:hypothetical protein [Silvanigrellaceae bacterium]
EQRTTQTWRQEQPTRVTNIASYNPPTRNVTAGRDPFQVQNGNLSGSFYNLNTDLPTNINRRMDAFQQRMDAFQQRNVSQNQNPFPTHLLFKDLDEEYKEIKNISIFDSEEREKRLAQLSLAHLHKGDLKKALKRIEELFSDTKTKESIITKIAEEYYAEGNLKDALETIKKLVWDSETKESISTKIAESYFVRGDLDEAFNAIDVLFHDVKTKEAFLIKLANAYFNKGDRKNALKAISKLHQNLVEKQTFIVKIAQSYFSDNDELGVQKAIEEIIEDALRDLIRETKGHECYNGIQKNHFAVWGFHSDLAKTCYEDAKEAFGRHDAQAILRGILTKATDPATVTAFMQLSDIDEERAKKKRFSCITELRETIVSQQKNLSSNRSTLPTNLEQPNVLPQPILSRNLEEESKEIQSITNSSEKEKRLALLAQAYFDKGDLENAFITIGKIYSDTKTKHDFLIKLAQSYFSNNDEEGVIKSLQVITTQSFILKIVELDYNIFLEVAENLQRDFHYSLAKTCYEHTKELFEKGDSQAILQGIIAKATDATSVVAFLRLRKT